MLVLVAVMRIRAIVVIKVIVYILLLSIFHRTKQQIRRPSIAYKQWVGGGQKLKLIWAPSFLMYRLQCLDGHCLCFFTYRSIGSHSQKPVTQTRVSVNGKREEE